MGETRTERVLSPLRVGLRTDLHVSRQRTRGGVRYVVHDPASFRNHAFDPNDYRVLTAIVRTRSLGDCLRQLIADGVLEDSDEDRQGFYRFVLWLHGIGLLHLPITGGRSDFERHQDRLSRHRGPWYGWLLSRRIPIWNPDAFLDRTVRWFGWLFGTPGLMLWLLLLGTTVWKCGDRVGELFAESSNLLALANLPVLWVALVGLKVLHEFGHAYAAKRFGASVPEMGVQMIMLTPCAYVDAGASWKLANARQRIVVGLGGMYVESFVAALAALVWVGTGDGLVHDLALNVVALASVVTLLFNINPLMKYDGYFVFSDLVGVFNLQQRASAYLKGLANHLALGIPRPRNNFSPTERLLYATYGPLAFAYRVTLAFMLTGLMMTRWPQAGLLLGAVFAWALIVRPAATLLRYLWLDGAIADQRLRARVVAIGLLTLVPMLAGLLPISRTIVAPGVLDSEQRLSVRAPVAGFVRSVEVGDGEPVTTGDVLCVLQNPELEMRRLRLAGELEAELEGLDAVELQDPTRAAIHEARVAYLRASMREIDQRLVSMTMSAPADGTIANPNDDGMSGRYLQQGEELMQVHAGRRYLRVLLSEDEVTRAHLEVGSEAEARWTCAPDSPVRAVVREIRSAASRFDLPPELTMLAGGDVYVAHMSDAGIAADRPYLHVLFEVDSVPLEGAAAGLTARVLLPARVELLGGWVRRRLLSFWNTWRMS